MVRARLVSINEIKQIRTVCTNVLSKSYECSKIIINLFIVSVIINLNKIKREFLPSARMQASHSNIPAVVTFVSNIFAKPCGFFRSYRIFINQEQLPGKSSNAYTCSIKHLQT